MGLASYFTPNKAEPPPASPDKQPDTAPTTDRLMPPTPRYQSRPSSSGRSTPSTRSSVFLDDIKHEVMVNYLYQQQCSQLWVSDGSGEVEGVLLRKTRGCYMACPPRLGSSPFAIACAAMNLQCAMTVNSRVIKSFLQWSPDAVDVPLMGGLRIQILPTLDDLARARKHQFAAFVASEGLLVVWDDDPLHLVQRARAIESELMELVWKAGPDAEADAEAEKRVETDEESGETRPEKRPVHLQNSILVSLTLALVVTSLGAAWRQLAIEVSVDGNYTRLALVALCPLQIFFSLFFAQVIVGCLAQILGPIRQLSVNSKFFSARPPSRLRTAVLPHVTIQCPVYKEGLHAVIAPTVRSVKQAMSTYELQGGSANIFINDDGLQLMNEVDRSARIDFYADNNIGWVARPAHRKDGFQRKGKFKKASNMNYGLKISCAVEDRLKALDRPAEWSQHHEALTYEEVLKDVLDEDGLAWADGNVRMGDYILLIDSDTRVPPDCLLDAVSEMEQSPDVAILQFSSGVMQVVHTYFENGIRFFTDLIYTAISYTVSSGDVAPFVGHNACLRWTAIQQVSYRDEDGYDKFWSESHVSEDFDMSLRLQTMGYVIRLATWAGDGFREGVSLTVYDELARWEKYAYGCNELLFNPIRTWLWRGPFTPLFRRFLGSNIRFTSKITVLSYIGTYYAIGAAWIMTVVNYFLVGWFNGYLDKYYVDSWRVWFSIVIVFNGLGNVALAVMRYRAGERTLMGLFENFKWTLMLAIFLGGLSLHISQALLAHMFEVDISWGATSKEAEFANFFTEIPKVLKKFSMSMLFSIVSVAVMVVLAVGPVPRDWRIDDFTAILPLSTVVASHFLLPLALNPALMTFSF
ncbi:Glycosyl transferase, family 2 [Ophiocordyceps camponoti-floridani]|uniref:Glycosyl transferase, family 2 n=1 Tax=Ophiocordyceps camponoti-floridani TaxID=2030778 RepID=A0A8H4QDB6_9HYPO|nr:Glycosyl transferase, family 2 [Ophiocordyceps camponoti-floridani]